MMKVQIVKKTAPEEVLPIKLPEDWEVLKEKLEVFGVKAEGYSIRNVCSPLEFVEELTHPEVRVELLNALAIRLKRLPVFEAERLAALCEADKHLTFRKLFCLLDERTRPERPKEIEVYLPATIGLVRTQKGGKIPQWYGQPVLPDAAEEYFDVLETLFQKHLLPETGLRGLAVYLPEGKLQRKIFSILPAMCRLEDGIFGCFHCQLSDWLTEAEEKELKDCLLHLLVFGWGRTFHYDGCAVADGFLRLSFSGVGAKLKPLYEKENPVKRETLPELIHVEVYPVWAKGDEIEEMAEIISLPADPWTLLDWMERLRVNDEAELHTVFFGSAVAALEEYFWMEIDEACLGGSIGAWNQLAMHLVQMDAVSMQHMETLLQQVPRGLSVMGMLQLAESIQKAPVFLPVPYRTSSEMVQILFLDEEKRLQREVLLPKEKQCLTESEWRTLTANAAFVNVFCRVPALCPVLYEEQKELQNLIVLSEVLEELELNGDMVRYKALLELLAAPDLNMVIRQKEQLEQYFFYEDCRTFEEAGCRFFEEVSGRRLMEEEKESIRFREYGKRMLLKAGGVETSYGFVIPKTGGVYGKE